MSSYSIGLRARSRSLSTVGWAIALVATAPACGAAPAPGPAERPVERAEAVSVLEQDVSAAVRALIAESGTGFTFLPLAQVDCGARVVAVLWPALDPSGAVVDDDVIGHVFERTPTGELARVAANVRIRSIEDLGCGAALVRVHRARVGVPRGAIAEALRTRLADVVAASDARDRSAFGRATLRLSELFPDEAMFEAFTDAVAELIEARVVIESAVLVPEGIAIRARSTTGGRVEEDTLPLLPVPGGDGELVVIDVGR